jgi:hypothetical protein
MTRGLRDAALTIVFSGCLGCAARPPDPRPKHPECINQCTLPLRPISECTSTQLAGAPATKWSDVAQDDSWGEQITVDGFLSTGSGAFVGAECECCGRFDAYARVLDPTRSHGLRLTGYATTGAGLRHGLDCAQPTGRMVVPRFERTTVFGALPWNRLHKEPPPEPLGSRACCTIPTDGQPVRVKGTLRRRQEMTFIPDDDLVDPVICTMPPIGSGN